MRISDWSSDVCSSDLRRVNAIRGDLADVALAGRYFAPHYSCPQTFLLTAPRAAIRSKAHMSSTAISELLHGEMFQAIDIAGGWAWGYCVHEDRKSTRLNSSH